MEEKEKIIDLVNSIEDESKLIFVYKLLSTIFSR